MGLPAGWITDVISADTVAVRIGGLGVVPQAAAIAWEILS